MSTTRWRPELTTVKMLYTAESPAQPTKLKLPNLTFTEPNLSYQTYKNQYTLLNPTKSKQRNQTFAKHTYWTIPFKRNRLSQIYSVQFQELKHSKKQTNPWVCWTAEKFGHDGGGGCWWWWRPLKNFEDFFMTWLSSIWMFYVAPGS